MKDEYSRQFSQAESIWTPPECKQVLYFLTFAFGGPRNDNLIVNEYRENVARRAVVACSGCALVGGNFPSESTFDFEVHFFEQICSLFQLFLAHANQETKHLNLIVFIHSLLLFFLLQHYFTITYRKEGSKMFELKADSETECNAWVHAIEYARWVRARVRVGSGVSRLV